MFIKQIRDYCLYAHFTPLALVIHLGRARLNREGEGGREREKEGKGIHKKRTERVRQKLLTSTVLHWLDENFPYIKHEYATITGNM